MTKVVEVNEGSNTGSNTEGTAMSTSNLMTKTGSELAALYNKAAVILGEQPVKKFSDKATAVTRVKAIWSRVPKTDKSSPKPEENPRTRVRRDRSEYAEFKKYLSRESGASIDFLVDELGKSAREIRGMIDVLRAKGHKIERVAKKTFRLVVD